jgi:hypothetical protein
LEFTYSFHKESGFLLAKMAGDWDLEQLKQFASELHANVKDWGYRSILIDAQQTTTYPKNRDRFLYGEYVATLFRGYKIALTIKKEYISSLFENVAFNRGVIISIFDNAQDAMRWLMPNQSTAGEKTDFHQGSPSRPENA